MTKQQIQVQNQKLRSIHAGVNYPVSVKIHERVKGKMVETTFGLCSYYVGMYCGIYCNGALLTQSGDHNNRTFVAKLKRDITNAIDRGATVEIGPVLPVKSGLHSQ
jgi:hypothetical protein